MCAAGRAALAMGRQRARDVILMRQPRVGATMHRPWRNERTCWRYLSGTGQYLPSPRQGRVLLRRLPTYSLQYSSTACSRNKARTQNSKQEKPETTRTGPGSRAAGVGVERTQLARSDGRLQSLDGAPVSNLSTPPPSTPIARY
ncbi:hypothetical protein BHE90_010321 [Fusarium euwallaceae]|uniref:Uncharacterized protein n=3 Tax=Fusarium solani species complex TaxID=232080 RepID=A0A3M2RW58_9HYPO|nr:hypothetical protein CDV36_010829 [Fusarium kuroshium]RSL84987.1 hypothetical protein CEP51_003576 [Fusarium floridanum]RTE75234.1 hypothetical protein BHE90_010321 [Fusarium euwallaceae]